MCCIVQRGRKHHIEADLFAKGFFDNVLHAYCVLQGRHDHNNAIRSAGQLLEGRRFVFFNKHMDVLTRFVTPKVAAMIRQEPHPLTNHKILPAAHLLCQKEGKDSTCGSLLACLRHLVALQEDI